MHILPAIACYVTTPSCVPEDSSALPYALDSVDHNPGKQPNCLSSNLLGYIRSQGAWNGQDYQSHLCCCLDNTSPRFDFTSTSAAASGCSIPRPEGLVSVSPCLCPPSGPQLFHSQVNFTSQERACKCTFDFHSQVTSPLKNEIGRAHV